MAAPPAPLSPQDLARRRQRVADRLQNGVLLLYGGELRPRAGDTHYPFRPDSDFYYLTGLAEPGAVLALMAGTPPGATLFVRPRDREQEIWSGRRLGPDGAAARAGVEQAHPLDELSERLPDLLDGHETIFLALGRDEALDRVTLDALATLRRGERNGRRAPTRIHDARIPMGEERLRKDGPARAAMLRAVELTCAGHRAAMASCRPGLYEHQIQATVEHVFRSGGASGPGYGSIVATGTNATILHYVENCAPLRDGELLLVDAGAEWDTFTGDVTRTYPVSGRFTAAQRDLYQIVLAANEAGIAAVTPGATVDGIHARCLEVLCRGLLDLGLLSGSLDEVLDTRSYRRYYMHRTSHWLGADVHDVGRYALPDGAARPLEPSMVLTVEPGLYVAEDDEQAPAELRGTGIRIEDDVWVTDTGAEVLTAGVPKDVAALEALVGSAAD